MSGIPMVILNDGQEVPRLVCAMATISLKAVEKENYLVLLDLVKKCKDVEHKLMANILGDSKLILKKHALLDNNGYIHVFIRAIVLNSVEVSGMKFRLVSPIQAKK